MRTFRDGVKVGEHPVFAYVNGNRIHEIRLDAKDVEQLWRAAREKPQIVVEIMESWATHLTPESR